MGGRKSRESHPDGDLLVVVKREPVGGRYVCVTPLWLQTARDDIVWETTTNAPPPHPQNRENI